MAGVVSHTTTAMVGRVLSQEDLDHAAEEQDLKDPSMLASLSLGGMKLASLGVALHGLQDLVHIDLSRNAITSFRGLERCPSLTRLVVYYNKIADCREVLLLKANEQLQELDCRLNPVTRIDYYRR